MTTLVNFVESAQGAPQFAATLDGALCTVVCTWNLFGQRYYINILAQDGTSILTRPMTGSPDDDDFNLINGYFTTSTMVFRASSQQFEITP
jgi:hypothetical protein